MAPAHPDELSSWQSDWPDLTVVVVGLGEEGFAIADTLAELGARVTVVTTGQPGDRGSILEVLGVTIHQAPTDAAIPGEVASLGPELVIVSPQWEPPGEVEAALWAQQAPVWSDVEFSWRVADKYGDRPDIVFIAPSQRAPELADVAQRLLLHGGLRAARAGVDAPPVLDALRHPDGIDALLWTLTHRQLWRMGLESSSFRRPRVSVGWGFDESHGPEPLLALYAHTIQSCLYQPDSVSHRALEQASVVEGARAIGIVVGTPGMSDLGRVEDVIVDRAFLPDRKDRALELCTLDELLDAGFRSPEAVDLAIAACGIARALDVAPEVIGGAFQAGGWPERK